MFHILDELRQLIQRLFNAPNPALIQQVAKASQPGAIPDLLLLVFNKDPEVARTAVSALCDLVALVPPSKRAAMDGLIREVGEGWRGYGSPWYSMKAEDLSKLESFGSESRCCLLGLATSHPNGYVRQQALTRLDTETSGRELPFILLRLNDWVQQVKVTALSMLRKRLKSDYAAHFVANLAHVQRLISCGRSDHADFVGSVRALLSKPENLTHLLPGMDSEDAVTRRMCFEWAVKAEAVADEEILLKALHDKDIIVRLWSAKTIRSLSSPRKLELITQMSVNRFMPVRREALYFWAEQAGAESDMQLRKSLIDPNRAMREAARFYLSKRVKFDFTSFYRSKVIERTEPLAPVLLGLGETGTKADADLLQPFLASENVQVAKAAISALNRLDGENRVAEIFRLVNHPHPGVSAEATNALLNTAAQLDPSKLQSKLVADAPLHVRLNALKLISHLDQWTKLLLLMEIADIKSPVQIEAKRRLGDWLKQYNYMVKPSGPEQVRKILVAINVHTKVLDAAFSDRVKWILKD